ncbi:N amino acid transport system protein [Vanrija pseudolonga]|uniref:N amino acid transport system protein n=1 Tax=Vanrija pseudolonga TaxID=143232 RepID=A0AAF0YFM1_9TREE|nr:N amino acid transport system protein [Vanrija pseudolonga]
MTFKDDLEARASPPSSTATPPNEKSQYSAGVYDTEVDAVFGAQGEGHVNYTSMGWIKTAVILTKTQIALGILAMPTALQALGGVPGTLLIVGLGLLTTWSDYVVGLFKRNHPEVYSMSDVGFILFGKAGREFFTAAYALFMIAITGAAFVPISIAFNTITTHATCTVVWAVIGAVGCFAGASIQTLNKVSIIGWIGVGAILTSVLIVTIGVGVQDRPAAAPQPPLPWEKDIHAFKSAGFWDAINSISTVIFGLCGTPAFFSIMSEMKDQRMYNRSLALCQTLVISTYTVIGVVVYYYCGQYLAAPALGSAGPLLKKVCYGIALPGLFASAILYCHCGAKLIFVRLMRDSVHLTAHSFTHWAVWLGIVGVCTLLAFILAMAIPFFGPLVSLIGALFGTIMCMQSTGWMWLHDNWAKRKDSPTLSFWLLAALNWFLIVFGSFIWVSGIAAGAISIRDAYRSGTVSKPFSCADNSG